MGKPFLDPRFIEHLLELPFVRDVRVGAPAREADASLVLVTPKGPASFDVEVKSGPLQPQVVGLHVARQKAARAGPRPLLAVPHVPRALGHRLVAEGINFVDLAGNCYIRVGDAFLATVEGRPAVERLQRVAGLRGPGHQVVFALLIDPALVAKPIRTIAAEVGVGKSVVADALRVLEQRGILVRGRKGQRLVERRALARFWLGAYAEIVRPSLVIGRFRTQEDDPGDLERRILPVLDSAGPWGWGGTAAEDRVLAHYRGAETIVHLLDPPSDLARRLRALPDENGKLQLMRAPGLLALRGIVPHTVHPLLIYAELQEGDERAREAAVLLAERHLEEFI